VDETLDRDKCSTNQGVSGREEEGGGHKGFAAVVGRSKERGRREGDVGSWMKPWWRV
jgi:hypothetical protein